MVKIPLFVAMTMVVHSFVAGPASAHARWFLGDETSRPAPPLIMDRIYVALIVIAVLLVAAGFLLDRIATARAGLARYSSVPLRVRYHLDWRLLSIAFGSTLIINSMSQVLVAPDLPLGSGVWATTIAFLQIVIGAMFVLQSRLLVAALAAMLLPLSCWALYSFAHAVDYVFELIGIGGAMFLVAPLISTVDRATLLSALRNLPQDVKLNFDSTVGPISCHWRAETANVDPSKLPAFGDDRALLAAKVLRITLGLQLLTLAAHDKLLGPSPSLAFVEKFSFVNVPAMLGFESFTNLHFVVGAGLIEAALGVMLVANVAVRAVAGLLLVVFSLTSCIFGVHELIGHLPIMAALVVLFASGSGRAVHSRSPLSARIMLQGSIATVIALVVLSFQINAPSAIVPREVNGSTIPDALYRRFVDSRPRQLNAQRDLERAHVAVKVALAAGEAGRDVDKDDLARRMFELSVRYEQVHGRDAASVWLRYSHLAATCSHDDLLAFRMAVGSENWNELLQRAPSSLVAELVPIARKSAEVILKRSVAVDDQAFWQAVAALAPVSGPNFIHTHTLATIARIIKSAASEKDVWVNSVRPTDKT